MSTRRILVVDDESGIRHAVADYLTECGYETSMAADGAEGLLKARVEQFHAVLVDLRMPRVDGLQVIGTLKTEQPELPLVVVSGTGALNDVIEAMRQGAWDYVTKPVRDIAEIAIVVERVIERASLIVERDRYQHKLEELNGSLEAEVARQTRDLRTQNRELTALNRVSWAIVVPPDLETTLNWALDAAIAAVEADGGIVRLINPATNHLVVAAVRGLPEFYIASAQTVPLGAGIVGQVAQSGHPYAECSFADGPEMMSLEGKGSAWSPFTAKDGFHSCLCLPLRAGNESVALSDMAKGYQIVGTLEIAMRAEHGFDAREVELLSSIGNQIGVAVARIQYASDLKQANTQLRRLDDLRRQFIQNVAHELRTPLGIAHGYVEMLVRDELDLEEQQMALDTTSQSIKALVRLVESITTLQDMDEQSLHIAPVAPAKLVQLVVQMHRQRALDAGITLYDKYHPDMPHFPGDFDQLAQALYQLVDNACKFSHAGARVTVAAQRTEDAILISVFDQGIGIPSDEHTYIFDSFYQVDGSTSRRYGGTGLGLAVVEKVVQAHGGTVSVQSAVGKGSTFTMTLPLTHSPPVA